MRQKQVRVAVDSISFDVNAGEHVALLGPNGSGKSTLLRILATLDVPDEGGGEVEILGTKLSASASAGGQALRATRARLGVVFQSPGLDDLLTVGENLLAQAALFGYSGESGAARVETAAARLGLDDRLSDRVRTLSGGLARRTDLARAILHDPELLLLDEATVGLDHRARLDFLAVVRELSQERPSSESSGATPLTVFSTTHHMDEAEIADRVILMHQGKIVADGPPAELRRRLGAAVVRCAESPAALEIVTDAGLEVSVEGDRRIVARPGDAAMVEGFANELERAAVGLTRAAIPFEIAPPTLGDLFLSLTGSGLESAPSAVPDASRRGRRSRGDRA